MTGGADIGSSPGLNVSCSVSGGTGMIGAEASGAVNLAGEISGNIGVG